MEKLTPIVKQLRVVSYDNDDNALIPMDDNGVIVQGKLIELIARALFDWNPETEKVILKNGIFDDIAIHNIKVVPK